MRRFLRRHRSTIVGVGAWLALVAVCAALFIFVGEVP